MDFEGVVRGSVAMARTGVRVIVSVHVGGKFGEDRSPGGRRRQTDGHTYSALCFCHPSYPAKWVTREGLIFIVVSCFFIYWVYVN